MTTSGEDTRQFIVLPINKIVPDPNQPRKDLNPATLQELADSIKAMGVEQPINVRKHPSREDTYMIISGERRWRASKMAGLTDIPALIRDHIEEKELRRRQLAENYNRDNFNSVEEAEFLQAWIDTLKGEGVESPNTVVANDLGISLSSLSKKLSVLKFSAEIRALVRDGLVREHAALSALDKLTKADRQLVIEQARSGQFSFKSFRQNQTKALRELRVAKVQAQKVNPESINTSLPATVVTPPTTAPASASPTLHAKSKVLARWHMPRETIILLLLNSDYNAYVNGVNLDDVPDQTLLDIFEKFKIWLHDEPATPDQPDEG